MPPTPFIPLTPDLVKQAALSGADAFAGDVTTLYLIPDPKKRPNLRYAFEYYLRLSLLENEEAYVTSPKCEGLAIWRRSDAPSSFTNSLRAGWPWLPLRCGWAYLSRDANTERHYEKLRRDIAPRPHMYLALLSVAPDFQRQGFASRLVRPMLARLDAERLPAYLETQNLRNVAMYERFGFRLEREDILPGTNLRMYLLVHHPPALP